MRLKVNRGAPVKASTVRKKIAVCSAVSGSGVSFTSMLLARALSAEGTVTLVELGKPYFYDAFGFASKFTITGFCDYFAATEKKRRLPELANLWSGINWALRKSLPGEPAKELSPSTLFRLINSLPGNYLVLDCSGLEGDSLLELLAEADDIIIVVDPLPGKLLPGTQNLQRLRLKFPDARIVVNKMNPGVHRAEFEKYLGSSDYICLPALDAKTIYKAEYSCILPCDLPGGSKLAAALEKRF